MSLIPICYTAGKCTEPIRLIYRQVKKGFEERVTHSPTVYSISLLVQDTKD